MSSPSYSFLSEILSEDDLNVIRYCLAVEKVWFGRWRELRKQGRAREHWALAGEDAWTEIEETVLDTTYRSSQRLIDMRSYLWTDVNGREQPIGYVPCERILPWRRGVVPTVLNKFTRRWFNRELFGYQLYIYYQCQPMGLVVGGRGSAKTEGVALAAASWISLHPGQAWAHFAYTGVQAMEVYNILTDLGGAWIETFVRKMARSPHGYIKLRPWHEFDPGNFLVIRPLGQAAEATTTRSLRVRRTSIDECTRDIADESVLAVAEASARGLNDVAIAMLPPSTREEIERAKQIMDVLDKKRRQGQATPEMLAQLEAIENKFWEYGITCHLTSFRTGNRGPHHWVDEWLAAGDERPEDYFAAKVSYLINPHLDVATRAKLEATYAGRTEQMRVELFAEKPMGLGQWFPYEAIAQAESRKLSERLQIGLRTSQPGWELNYHGPYVVRYQAPPRRQETGFYMLGADPGTGVVPKRDAWVVMVWWLDLESNVMELDAFSWGNVGHQRAREWQPFIEEMNRLRTFYGIPAHNCCVQVGGQERGILEIAWGRDFANYASVDMSVRTKAIMANYTRDMLSCHILRWPLELSDISSQLSNWDFDDKELAQDIVMAVFASCFLAYPRFQPAIRQLLPHTGRPLDSAHLFPPVSRHNHAAKRVVRLV